MAATTPGARPVRVRILLVGYGSVGRAFHALALAESNRLPRAPRFVAIARSKGAVVDEAGVTPASFEAAPVLDGSALDLVERLDYDVLVELSPTDLATGGEGLKHVRAALSRGKDVVTANKGPIVLAYQDLSELARAKGARLRFEGTVGGAIPLLNTNDRSLVGNPVTRIDGILNGTSNFILTRMMEEGLAFEAALSEAQALGFAEADPTADVDGHDAAAKLVILANHVLGLRLRLGDVEREGIRHVTDGAVRLAKREGFAIRLIASVERASGHARVAPRLVPLGSTLNVGGALNVARFTTQHAGPLTFTGKGAGGKETATAVLSDLASLG